MTQVHKETLGQIDNALPNRSNLDVEIFGMEGIPEDVVQSHNSRVLTQFAQAEAERRAASGNPAPGSAAANAAKKPKFESPSDIKKRLAEHKAKKAAEEAMAGGSGGATPLDTAGNQSPGFGQPPGFVSLNPHLSIDQEAHERKTAPGQFPPQPFGAPPNATNYGQFPQPYGQPPTAPFQQPPQAYGNSPGPQFNPPNTFSPPQQQHPPVGGAYAPPQQYQAGPPQPQFPGGPTRPFGTASPPVPFRVQTPPQGMSQPQPSASLPTAPGLPQRPTFNTPSVNAYQMQQLHQGQAVGLPTPPPPAAGLGSRGGPVPGTQNGISQDKLSQPAQNPAASGPGAQPSTSAAETPAPAKKEDGTSAGEKKLKKDKDKETRMVVSDNETSPEEKMARLPRYAFSPGANVGSVGGVGATSAAAS